MKKLIIDYFKRDDLTVLICCHSQDNLHDILLLNALRSLEYQTYRDFKVLIVLDECWSQTEHQIKSGNFNLNIEIKTRLKKEGLAFAKNYGLSFIDTSWVAFLDADDLYIATKLEHQIKFIQNNEVDFLGTSAWNQYVDINGNRIGNIVENWCPNPKEYETHEQIKSKIFTENPMTHGSLMIRKSCLDKLQYHHVKGVEDWDLWKRAFLYGYKFYQLPERLYIWTHGTNVPR